jgi:hypothetical protein
LAAIIQTPQNFELSMIITDPSKRPKERFTEVVQDYFFEKGYTYKKSLNQFERVIDNRKEMTSIWYNKTINLVRATMSWAVLFPEVEKFYKKVNVEEWQNSTTTLWTDLLNYHPLRKSDVPRDFDLYNSADHQYDDISINNAAFELIKSYEKYVEPFFDNYKNLQTLERELNTIPLQHHFYIGYGGRQIAIGLALGKKFQSDNFNSLKTTYQDYINNDKEGEEFKRQMQKYFDSTVAFLEQNDIDKVIP